MSTPSRWVMLIVLFVGSGFAIGFSRTTSAQDGVVTHTPTGMQFTGGVAEDVNFIASGGGVGNPARLLVIFEGARKVIVPRSVSPSQGVVTPAPEIYELQQSVVNVDRSSIRSVGSVLRRMPFNEYGRRQIFVETNKGPVWLLEGITELAPTYARVQGLEMDGEGLFEFPFDYRIATTTIPGDLLVAMLRNATNDLSNYTQRLRIVEFLINAERYRDALRELQQLLVDFPDIPDLQKENAQKIRRLLATSSARLILDELEMRREAGQFQLVKAELEKFDPTDVSPETVTQADSQRRQLVANLQAPTTLGQKIQQEFDDYLASANLDPQVKQSITKIRDEVVGSLNPHNVDRMATYTLRSQDSDSTVEKRVSFIVSGWLLGAAAAIDNMEVTLSMPEVRELMIRYLNSTNEAQRNEILDRLAALEAGSVNYLAAMARNLLPWKSAPKPEAGSVGFFRLKLEQLPGQPEFLVQLPPEYNPYRKYPCIVSICDSGQTPEREMEWWDGAIDPNTGLRTGNASRHGYITLTPDWRQPLSFDYDYGPYAANVVLSSLRETSRMFSVDSDRVFLAGHGIGGEVAWDLGLAHPDLWAGVMPISALADRYISFYDDNSKYNLPFYFVLGENHLPPPRGMVGNLDKREDVFKHMALSRNFNFIVVVYRGRRSEHFYEEILNLFTWMRTQRRKFDLPEKKFEVRTMRPWDNFFWFYEMADIPRTVLPPAWEITEDKGGLPIEGEIKQSSSGNTNLQVSGGGDLATFWISPDWVDMDQEVFIRWDRARDVFRNPIPPARHVILEDLRRRSDTQHPFWAKVQCDRGQWQINDGR